MAVKQKKNLKISRKNKSVREKVTMPQVVKVKQSK